jgi:beta-N-acetylhexosaminidase
MTSPSLMTRDIRRPSRRVQLAFRRPVGACCNAEPIPGIYGVMKLTYPGWWRPVVLAAILALPLPFATASSALAAPTYAQLVGQKLMVAMSGTTPSADLLGRVGRGEVGGVILFGSNITSAAGLRALSARLQAAAAGGGQPSVLIATDQEGGSVRRIPWAAPTLSAPQMGRLGSAQRAFYEGKATGIELRCGGINNDLAPVADVPLSTSSFMYQQGRTWSFDAPLTATLSDAFASGLEAGGDLPTMKHFPGIGRATLNTDTHVVMITASTTMLAPGLQPYQKAIGHGIPMIMLSNATYTAYDSANAAGWSHAISVGLLRTTMGFSGVSITDSLTGTAAARGVTDTSLAVKAARAGTDMIMLTGSEASTKASYATLLLDAQNGTIPLATLQASYSRILALKARVSSAVPDSTPPAVKPPLSGFYAGSTLGSTTAPVRTSWSAADSCAISGYALERSINGGSWVGQALSTATATSVSQALTFGWTWRYVVRASDGAGNVSGWHYGASEEPLLTQQSSTAVRYGGTWPAGYSSGYSGGSTRYATASGAWASYTFTGSSIGWVAAVGPSRGSANVYIDGAYQRTVSLYSSTTALRRVAYAFTWAVQATHTIRIAVVGTAGHPRVDLDGFVRLYRP